MTLHIAFDNSYAALPAQFYTRMPPTPVRAPGLVKVNAGLAAELGIDAEALASDAGVAMLVESLSEILGLDVRRIEMSPRGVYLITAESTADPQYGLGDCRSDLDRAPSTPGAARASDTDIEVGVRGLTRF